MIQPTQMKSNLDINEIYQHFKDSFIKLPQHLIDHRIFFKSNSRGFGEDAFHAMWFHLFDMYRPRQILEIGVYRGQTLSLFELIAKHLQYECNIVGVSPLTASNDSVSIFPEINYLEDIRANFKYFELGEPNIIKGSSIEKGPRNFIKATKWDLIYIDGNHDMPYVISDFMNCADSLSDNGILVMDDSSYYKPLTVPGAFKGHVAPSQVLELIAAKEMDLLLTVGHNNVLRAR